MRNFLLAQVFLISDYVVKLYVEGGLESSVHGLGTELEFYTLLDKVKSPLKNHVPQVVASGLLVNEEGSYKPVPWDGRGVPDIISNCGLVAEDSSEEEFPFGVWRKKRFELKGPGSISHSKIWPYIVTKRCRGGIFAHLRDALPQNDVLNLVSFLGAQLRNLHLVPLPPFKDGIPCKVKKISLEKAPNGSLDVAKKPAAAAPMEVTTKDFGIPREWELIVATLNRQKTDLKDRLVQWGNPIPIYLIEKVEEYIPHDISFFFSVSENDGGLHKYIGSPTWIHSDIMDDNIHMESCIHASNATSPVNGIGDACAVEETQWKWLPTHILDFSDLTIGDPLYDLIPIHLDIFRGDIELLKRFLENYKLPLRRAFNQDSSWLPVEYEKKFRRISYRAMCYCILHEENILGAIFSLWKELKKAESWEEVEEVVWGVLNNYGYSD